MKIVHGLCRVSPVSVVFVGLLLSAAPARAQTEGRGADLRWSVRASGVLQRSRTEWVNWYTINPVGWDGESASNGTEGAAGGLDAVLEYFVTSRTGVGVAIGYVPTRLHAEVHRTAQGLFAKPRASVSFVPLRLTGTVALVRKTCWSVRVGPQVGTALLGSADVVPEFGRARHFEGDRGLLVGGHVVITGALGRSSWHLATTVQYLRTAGFNVHELHTGALPQHVPFNPWSIQVGLTRSFGKGRR